MRAGRRFTNRSLSARTGGHRSAVELLEERRLLSSVVWTGNGDGMSWTDPQNWSHRQLPGPADDVTIAVTGDGDHDDNGHGHDDELGDSPPHGNGTGRASAAGSSAAIMSARAARHAATGSSPAAGPGSAGLSISSCPVA